MLTTAHTFIIIMCMVVIRFGGAGGNDKQRFNYAIGTKE